MDLLDKYYSIKNKIEEFIKRKKRQIPNNLPLSDKKRLLSSFNINITFKTTIDPKTQTKDFFIYNKSKVIMHIQLSYVYLIHDLLYFFQNQVSELEKNIIILKNDILFQYKKHDNEKDDYYDIKLQLEYNLQKTNELQSTIFDSQLPLFDNSLFQDYILEYKHTIQNGNFKDAISYYLNTILPFLKKQEYSHNLVIQMDDGLVYLQRNQFNRNLTNKPIIKKIIYDESEIISVFSSFQNNNIPQINKKKKTNKNIIDQNENEKGFDVVDLSLQFK